MNVIEYICEIEGMNTCSFEAQVAGLMWYVKKQGYTVVKTVTDNIPDRDFRRDNLNVLIYGENSPRDTVLVFSKELIPDSLLPQFEKKNLKLIEVPSEVRESAEFLNVVQELKDKMAEQERQERASAAKIGRKRAREMKGN